MTTRISRFGALPVAAIVLLLLLSTSQLLSTLTLSLPQPASVARLRVEEAFGRLPLTFVENRGQLDPQVIYYLQGSDKTLYFTPTGVTFALTGRPMANDAPMQRWAIKLDFLGANPDARPVGQEKSEAILSYFKGSPEQWHTGLPTYSRIVYHELWPGIDLAYYGTVDRLKYEFLVRPGADPAQIRLAYSGTSDVRLTEAGQLAVSTPLGGYTDDTPVAYQEVDGQRVPVSLAYALYDRAQHATSSIEYGFRVGPYDLSRPLVLDPAMIVYCGYIGGEYSDFGEGIAVDGAGNAYVTGNTGSSEATFPAIVGPDPTYNGNSDVFVAKVKADGSGLDYCGYIGGEGAEYVHGIAIDAAGNAYVTGYTESSEATFPVVDGPDLAYNGGNSDAFVAKVNADGSGLDYCGYIGGEDWEHGWGVAVDGAGNAYVTGWTMSSEATFPVTGGPDLTYNGGNTYGDAFVAKVASDGMSLAYCGYIGGTDDDWGRGIAVDGAGNTYVTGSTWSSEATFPVAVGPDLTYNGGDQDAFAAKVKADGSGLDYCGYIGGDNTDSGEGIAVDGAGNAYVTGNTGSSEATFPVPVGPDLTYNGGYSDAFVAKVESDGMSLAYSGYIGGEGDDGGAGIAVDGAGNAYVTGWTMSSEATFPVAGGPDLTYNDYVDAFVAKVESDGTSLAYCGYIGGEGNDWGRGITVDGVGNAYVTGYNEMGDVAFPKAVGPDLTHNGYSDAFVAKVAQVASQPPVNDHFADAVSIPSVPFDDAVDTELATAEDGEPMPSCANDPVGRTVWYSFTPDESESVSAYVQDAWFSPAVAAYTGASLAGLSEIGARCWGERLTFLAEAGTTYYIQVRGVSNEGSPLHFYLESAPPLQVEFSFYPYYDPSIFDVIWFYDGSWDPAGAGIESQAWEFGDGTSDTGCCPTHRYVADGDYTVQLTVTTGDGRTGSTSQTVSVRTHDVAIVKFSVPKAASAGQTRSIVVGVSSKRYLEGVEVQLFKSVPGDYYPWEWVGTLRQSVPLRPGGRTTDFKFSYTFTPEDASIGKVTFKAVAYILDARDALPADNEAIATPTKVSQ